MKKKVIKEYSKLFNREFTITINKSLKPSPPTGDGLAARKLAAAIEHLSKNKNIEEFLQRHANDPSHK
jgi:hypothetical protein